MMAHRPRFSDAGGGGCTLGTHIRRKLGAPECSRFHFSCKFLTGATSWDRRCIRRARITSHPTRRCSRMDKVCSFVLMWVKARSDHIGYREGHLHFGRRAHHNDVPVVPLWPSLRLEGICCLLLYPLRGKCFNLPDRSTSPLTFFLHSCATIGMLSIVGRFRYT